MTQVLFCQASKELSPLSLGALLWKSQMKINWDLKKNRKCQYCNSLTTSLRKSSIFNKTLLKAHKVLLKQTSDSIHMNSIRLARTPTSQLWVHTQTRRTTIIRWYTNTPMTMKSTLKSILVHKAPSMKTQIPPSTPLCYLQSRKLLN